ncbi:MAG TPA: sigma-70 family RNA polymerase sigma factor [Candidatus Eisenbergiella merdipullorum]|uniref:Sigma-70 family RNA polymerase sigma factor n=1 Tax=Candidatus Eisenbergiella merdipullorum TaxID=2838553 RepID=A0A9D2L0F9_9FIRM|nr:sigma-70 family RNA polymerase sigma factor [Candidatus Eisenbergiella merdipullorum]
MKQDIYDLTVAHVLEYQEKAYRLAYSYVQDRDAALDVVQNAVCQALEKCWGVKNPAALKTWYYRIIVNEALQYLRKNRREISTQPEEMKEEAYLEDGYERADDEDARVFAQVLKLSPEMKTVVILRFYEQMGLAEIAKVTGTNLNTVKTRLYAALKKLRKSLEEMEYERA